jgi:bifunctional DNA-binding transcriptional regulator/antitoxin component of YhaV-PrlF toxin-antitoxin module
MAYAFAGSNPASPIILSPIPPDGRNRRRAFSQIWGKRQLTIPHHICEAAQLRLGDDLRAHADRPGRVVFERIEPPTEERRPFQPRPGSSTITDPDDGGAVEALPRSAVGTNETAA